MQRDQENIGLATEDTLREVVDGLGAGSDLENAVQDVVSELQDILNHLEGPMADRAWVAEGAEDDVAAGWEKIEVTIPADSRKLSMFEVHLNTVGLLATLDYCWTHDAAGKYRITNNETLTIGAATLNPDGVNYSQCGSLGNVANAKPSFGVANTVWFWHRGNIAAGKVIPVLHGEL
jgi:hypothetical protein